MSHPWPRILPALALILGVLGVAPSPATASDDAPGLEAPARGRAAVRALGDELAPEVRAQLLTDRTAWVDRGGRLFFQDDVPEVSAAPAAPAAAAYPLDQTFALHSKPGSQRTVYLDFDGETVSGTYWNSQSGVATAAQPAWDLDGSPTTFGERERTAIQDIWARVAEDYAPFDVDVTTQDPGAAALTRSSSADQVYGTRALITPSTQAESAICAGGCGGVAYVGVYDDPTQHARLQPAWIFPHRLGNDTKNIAEAVSHEVGHNLGLHHDGKGSSDYYSGHGFWAPIMGAGYNAALVQWSQGSYAGATNTEDDLAVITSGGLSYRADEAGSTVATATGLPSGPAYISTSTDVDVYALGTCSGTLSVAGLNAASSPDLDLRLRLLNAAGTQVAVAGPTSAAGSPARDSTTGTDATVSALSLLPGSYFVEVDGVGNGSWATQYDDYGSLGAYTLAASGTCTGAPVAPAPQQPEVSTAGPEATSDTTAETAAAPGRPRTVKARSGRPGRSLTAGVRWRAPAGAEPAAITGYVVLARRVGGGRVSPRLTSRTLGPATTAAELRLPRGRYRFVVRAATSAGLGPWSAPSAVVRAR